MCDNTRDILYLDGGCMPAATNALGEFAARHSASISWKNSQISLISGALTGGIGIVAGLPVEEAVKIFIQTDISKLFPWKQSLGSVVRRLSSSIWSNPAAKLQNALHGLLGTEPLGEFFDRLFQERGLQIPENFLTMTVNERGERTVITGKGIVCYHKDGSRFEIPRPPRRIGPILRAAISIPLLMEGQLLRDVLTGSQLDGDALKGTPNEHAYALDGGLVADPTDTLVQYYQLADKRDITVFSSSGLRAKMLREAYFLLAHLIPGSPRLPHCGGFDEKQVGRLILTTVRALDLLNFKASPPRKMRGVFDAYDAKMGRLEESQRPTEEEQHRYKVRLLEFCGCEPPAGFNPHSPASQRAKRWRDRVA